MYRLKSPLRAQVELTEACNNACVHCYNFWRYQNTGKKLSSDDHSKSYEHFERILDVIIAQDIRTVTFTGGEPFLRRDVLFPLVKKAKSAGLCVYVNTNAALITQRDISKLKSLGIDAYLVSLLSYDEETHNSMVNAKSYAGTLRGISLLVEAGQSVSVNMVTSRKNWRHVRKTAQLLSSMGVESFSATPILSCYLASEHESINLSPSQVKQTMRDLTWAKDQLGLHVAILEPLVYCMFDADERRDFDYFLGSRYCCAGITDCVVSPSGELRPCILSTDIGGNILSDGWEDSWKNLVAWKEPTMLPTDCLSCSVVDDCGGGCRAAAKARYGEFNDKDPFMTVPLTTSAPDQTHERDHSAGVMATELLRPRSGLGQRSEPFGGALFYGDKHVFLKSEPYAFVSCLIESGSFSINSIVKEYNIDESDVREFLQVLVEGGYFVTAGEGGD